MAQRDGVCQACHCVANEDGQLEKAVEKVADIVEVTRMKVG